MNSLDFINTVTNAQIASALVLIATFLAIIAFKISNNKNSSKHHSKVK